MPQPTTPQPSRHPTPTARATSLADVVFERPELEPRRGRVFGLGATWRWAGGR